MNCKKQSNTNLWSVDTLRDPHAQPDKGLRVQRMFNDIAERYDLVNNLISFGQADRWRKKLVQMMADEQECSPARILDLCCGTGAMLPIIQKKFTMAQLVAVDFAERMRCLATKKNNKSYKNNEKKVKNNTNYLCADGMCLPLAGESIDAVSCVFGLRNYQSLTIGLDEIYRVLRKDGLLAVLDFQLPYGSMTAPLFRLYFEHILPILASTVSGKQKKAAYEYLPESVHHWYDINEVLNIMKNSGLTPVTVRSMCFGSVWAILAKK